jgi:hypothetical protein
MKASAPAPVEQRHPPRPLGGNEKAFWRLSEASPLNFAIVAHLRPGLDADRLRTALAGLQARHPLLRAQIELRAGEPWFVWPAVAPPIPLEERALDRGAWQAAIEDELRRIIPWQQAPLARLLLLGHGADGCTLALVVHHAIGDGIGAVAAVRDLLWEAVTGAPQSPLVHTQSRAAESALPPRSRGVRGGLRRIGVLGGLVAAGRRHRDPVRCPVRATAAPHERTYHLEPRRFDAATTSALAARARSAGTSVQGALGAAMIFGVARAADLRDERPVTLGSPINVRDRLVPPIGEQMGMYLAVSHYRGMASPATRFWDLARAIRECIADDLDSGRAVDAMPLIDLFYKAVGGDKASAQDFGRKWAESNGTTGVTNVGRIEFDPPPGLEIEAIHAVGFPSGLDVFNAVACAWQGCLQVNFNWPEPCFDRPSAIALVDDVEATLRAAIAGDPALGSRGH